jgi:hypothetical protein
MPVEILRRFDYHMLDFTKKEFQCTLNRLKKLAAMRKAETIIMAIHVSAHLQLFSLHSMSVRRFIRAENTNKDTSTGLLLKYAVKQYRKMYLKDITV